jgi:N-acetylglucosaminyldiphosphoundecaprenol N-acetyl-beta-D-mannosaminyltransferase
MFWRPWDVDSIEILGTRLDDATYEDVLALVDEFVGSGQAHQIVTVNPEMVMIAHEDPAFRKVLDGSHLNVADGSGLMLASRLLGQPLRERVTGSDGISRLTAHCATRGYRPYFLGAAPGVAEIVADKLAATYPGLEVAGSYAGSPDPQDEDGIIARVREAAPDLLFVAYGVPAEEKWIARNLSRLCVPVIIGVGGAFDFVAGVTRRAPVWMRRLGLEWLHRLVREPWRWRRQLALPKFVWLVVKQKIKGG